MKTLSRGCPPLQVNAAILFGAEATVKRKTRSTKDESKFGGWVWASRAALRLLKAAKVAPSVKETYMAIAEMADNRAGILVAKMETIAKEVGRRRETVSLAVAKLVELGLIEKRRFGQYSNAYRLLSTAPQMLDSAHISEETEKERNLKEINKVRERIAEFSDTPQESEGNTKIEEPPPTPPAGGGRPAAGGDEGSELDKSPDECPEPTDPARFDPAKETIKPPPKEDQPDVSHLPEWLIKLRDSAAEATETPSPDEPTPESSPPQKPSHLAPYGSLPGDSVDQATMTSLVDHWVSLGLEAKCPISATRQGYFKGGFTGNSESSFCMVIEAVNELGSVEKLRDAMSAYKAAISGAKKSDAHLWIRWFKDQLWRQFGGAIKKPTTIYFGGE